MSALPRIPWALRPQLPAWCHAGPAAGSHHPVTRVPSAASPSQAAAVISPCQPLIPAQPTQGRAGSGLFLSWILSPASSAVWPCKWLCWQSAAAGAGLGLGARSVPMPGQRWLQPCPGLRGGRLGILIPLRCSLSFLLQLPLPQRCWQPLERGHFRTREFLNVPHTQCWQHQAPSGQAQSWCPGLLQRPCPCPCAPQPWPG